MGTDFDALVMLAAVLDEAVCIPLERAGFRRVQRGRFSRRNGACWQGLDVLRGRANTRQEARFTCEIGAHACIDGFTWRPSVQDCVLQKRLGSLVDMPVGADYWIVVDDRTCGPSVVRFVIDALQSRVLPLLDAVFTPAGLAAFLLDEMQVGRFHESRFAYLAHLSAVDESLTDRYAVYSDASYQADQRAEGRRLARLQRPLREHALSSPEPLLLRFEA